MNGITIKNNVAAFFKGPLSQWYGGFSGQESKFWYYGQVYNCCEQGMMHQKALMFKDQVTACKIIGTSNPKDQKAFGREVRNFNQAEWDEKKFGLIVELNVSKFRYHEDLKKILKGTFPYVLVESSPYDTVWGCGTNDQDDRTYDIAKWQGQNLLGKALMVVREKLIYE